MNITLEQAIDMQRTLDEAIHAQHQLNPSETIQDRIIALSVELAELANELRFFKYWSQKPPAMANAHEEAADCLHFIISIGNTLGHKIWLADIPDVMNYQQTEKVYLQLQEGCKSLWLNVFDGVETKVLYEELLIDFMRLLKLVGIDKKELLYCYYVKNRINHERQNNGY